MSDLNPDAPNLRRVVGEFVRFLKTNATDAVLRGALEEINTCAVAGRNKALQAILDGRCTFV